mmetsp:Transcript_13483/g.30601  ORF Transcript_13483/g.30601 Transcript_13483/m.30601 type:complete len:202 (+) Transcript_13483:36-641(+)
MAEASAAKRGVLLPVCVGAGSVALLTTVGILPALYLAGGCAGGWYIGKRMRGEQPLEPRRTAEQAVYDTEAGVSDSDDSEDSSGDDDLDEGAVAESILAGANLNLFMQSLTGASGAETIAIPAEAKSKVEAGIHHAFQCMPPSDVEKLLAGFEQLSASQEKPSVEAIEEVRRLVDQVQTLMPEDALSTMKAYNEIFVPQSS